MHLIPPAAIAALREAGLDPANLEEALLGDYRLGYSLPVPERQRLDLWRALHTVLVGTGWTPVYLHGESGWVSERSCGRSVPHRPSGQAQALIAELIQARDEDNAGGGDEPEWSEYRRTLTDPE